MDMKFVRPLALAVAGVLPAELVLAELFEHHKHQHHIESIRVASPGQMVSNAANVALSTPVMVSSTDFTGLVLPESGRYLITVG
jgi:hypothetical protein